MLRVVWFHVCLRCFPRIKRAAWLGCQVIAFPSPPPLEERYWRRFSPWGHEATRCRRDQGRGKPSHGGAGRRAWTLVEQLSADGRGDKIGPSVPERLSGVAARLTSSGPSSWTSRVCPKSPEKKQGHRCARRIRELNGPMTWRSGGACFAPNTSRTRSRPTPRVGLACSGRPSQGLGVPAC